MKPLVYHATLLLCVALISLYSLSFSSTAAMASTVSPPTPRVVRVPILMYHYIRINPIRRDRVGADLSVSPIVFAEEMAYLAYRGYTSVTLDDLTQAILSGRPLPAHPVVLTFDDGYEDFYTAAYPVLARFGLKATSFIITGKVGNYGYLTWEQMRQMQASGLVQFESHTVHHLEMTHISLARAQLELTASKAALEKHLDRPVLYFCYPSGRFNTAVERLLVADGYVAGLSTRPGVVHSLTDLEALTRVRIHGGDTITSFKGKLLSAFPRTAAAPAAAVNQGTGPKTSHHGLGGPL